MKGKQWPLFLSLNESVEFVQCFSSGGQQSGVVLPPVRARSDALIKTNFLWHLTPSDLFNFIFFTWFNLFLFF